MKVSIVGNYSNDRQISIDRFVRLVERGLSRAGYEVGRVQAEPILGRFKPSPRGLGKWLGYIDKLVIFPFRFRRSIDRADVIFICDQCLSYLTPYLKTKKYFVVCHDMLGIRSALGEIPENKTSWTGRQYQSILFRGLKQAKYIVCSSETTRADVLRLTGLPAERTTAIEDCLNEGYGPMEKEEALNLVARFKIDRDAPWIVHVGGDQWYKNRLGLLKIFHDLIAFPGLENSKLILLGKPLTADMRQFIALAHLEKQVFELPGLSDEELRAFYSLGTALIFPSLQEGFGIPVIEAQACGCPVFTSNRPPMSENGGDAAVYFDPSDPSAAAAIVAGALLDRDRLEQMRQKGLINAGRFTYETMIRSYDELLKKL